MGNHLVLSVIVPIYNAAEFLPQCIESILKQSYKNFELLLVDDGSTDESLKICEAYTQKDSRIRLIQKNNGGLVSARKEGLKYAGGEYIGFVDADDWIDSNMYQCLCDAAIQHEADIVIADNVVNFPRRTLKVTQGIKPGIYNKQMMKEIIYPNLMFCRETYQLGISPSLCTKICRKSLLTPHLLSVEDCIQGGEDAACMYPCLLQAQKLVYVQNCYAYHYRVHNQSMTHRRKRIDIEERMTLLRRLYTAFQAVDYPGLDRQLGLYAISVVVSLVMNFFAYGGYRKKAQLKRVIVTVKSNPTWRYIVGTQTAINLPEPQNSVIKYLIEPNAVHFMKVYGIVKAREIKRLAKQVILRE